jgi:hypothetical protein
MRSLPLRAALALALLACLAAAPAAAQPAERVTPAGVDTTGLPSPRGALLRSLAVPGWGQIYNRQPLKAPVIVAGLGGLGYATLYSHNRGTLFRRAALWIDCSAEPPATDPAFCTDTDRLAAAHARADGMTAEVLTAARARNVRDQYRRQRDLFTLITLAAYGLQALDAYVAAQLADFDVGEDLAVGVVATEHGPALGLRITF